MMFQKILTSLKIKPKISEQEFHNGKWYCKECEYSIKDMSWAIIHNKLTKHPVFPIKIVEGTHRL